MGKWIVVKVNWNGFELERRYNTDNIISIKQQKKSNVTDKRDSRGVFIVDEEKPYKDVVEIEFVNGQKLCMEIPLEDIVKQL